MTTFRTARRTHGFTESVIREMVQSLQGAGGIEQAELESIVRAILKREELGSTGIGRGVAVPHLR